EPEEEQLALAEKAEQRRADGATAAELPGAPRRRRRRRRHGARQLGDARADLSALPRPLRKKIVRLAPRCERTARVARRLLLGGIGGEPLERVGVQERATRRAREQRRTQLAPAARAASRRRLRLSYHSRPAQLARAAPPQACADP